MTEKANKKDSGAQKSKKSSNFVEHRGKQDHSGRHNKKHITVIDTHPPPDKKPTPDKKQK